MTACCCLACSLKDTIVREVKLVLVFFTVFFLLRAKIGTRPLTVDWERQTLMGRGGRKGLHLPVHSLLEGEAPASWQVLASPF